jgi:hypothetical protein
MTRILNVAAVLNSDCPARAELKCTRKPHFTTVTGFICALQATGMEITRTRTQDSFKSLETRKRSESCFLSSATDNAGRALLFCKVPRFRPSEHREGQRTKHLRNDTDG